MIFNKYATIKASHTFNITLSLTFLHSPYSAHLDSLDPLAHIFHSVGAKNDEGVTSLHLACTAGYVSVVKKLIEYGADVNDIDDNGTLDIDEFMQLLYDVSNLW